MTFKWPLLWLLVVEDGKPADDILAKRGFESGAGVNLGNFLKSDIEEIKQEKEPEEPTEI